MQLYVTDIGAIILLVGLIVLSVHFSRALAAGRMTGILPVVLSVTAGVAALAVALRLLTR